MADIYTGPIIGSPSSYSIPEGMVNVRQTYDEVMAELNRDPSPSEFIPVTWTYNNRRIFIRKSEIRAVQ